MNIAIIGAGIAGLSAAAPLVAAGHPVELFDKGRGPGGRLSTRRVEHDGTVFSFDHGAQYFTVRDPAFGAAVRAWMAAGVVAEWTPRMTDALNRPAHVGVSGMSSLVRHLAAPLPVRWGAEVKEIAGSAPALTLQFADGATAGPFACVIAAVPAEQAAALLAAPAPDLARAAQRAVSAPCWAVMLAFDRLQAIAWDARQSADDAIAWMARNSSKPGRAGPETWVLHASPDWTRAHLETGATEVAAKLTDLFRERTGAGRPVYAGAHRWRFARVEAPLGRPFQYDPLRGIGTCGDWHLAARVEAAWQSGMALARDLLR